MFTSYRIWLLTCNPLVCNLENQCKLIILDLWKYEDSVSHTGDVFQLFTSVPILYIVLVILCKSSPGSLIKKADKNCHWVLWKWTFKSHEHNKLITDYGVLNLLMVVSIKQGYPSNIQKPEDKNECNSWRVGFGKVWHSMPARSMVWEWLHWYQETDT